MNTVEIYGAMIGPKGVAIGFLTTLTIYTATEFKGYIKKTSDSEFREIEGLNDKYTPDTNVRFRRSAWEFDFLDLETGTTYDLYITINGEESNHITFTTTTETSSINYEINYANYSSSGPVESTPSETQAQYAESFKKKYLTSVEAVGLVYNELVKLHLVTNPNTLPGADGLNVSKHIYMNIKTGIDAENRMCEILIHEMRHNEFFNNTMLGGGYGYASTRAELNGYDMDNFYKVYSFFDMNNNKSEMYYFYRENSCPDEHYLFDYFILKILLNEHVEITYYNN